MKPKSNDPCFCGSGKKYKHCCMGKAVARPALPTVDELNRLIALFNGGRLAEVESQSRTLVERFPDSGFAWKLLGATQHRLNKDALPALKKAVQLLPGDAEAHFNLGVTQNSLRQFDDAVASYRRAIALKPDYAEAYNNLGQTLLDLNQFSAAMDACRRALQLRLGYAGAHYNLGNTLKDLGRLDDAAASYRNALQFSPDFGQAYSGLLFLYSYNALLSPPDYLAEARNWERSIVPAQDREAARHKVFQRAPRAGRRLRVGYLSGDFRQHAVSYFIEQLFSQHDRSRIELFAYYTHNQRDAVTERLQELAEHWVPLAGLPDVAILNRIEADGIDVLVDLSGHTGHNRMAVIARRAAPVQAHYLGFMASSGLTEMDYWIGDEILTPPETDSHFSEQVWRLPRIWVSYQGKADAPLPGWHPAADGNIWLGSFNNLGKLTPATLALWSRILLALPEGRLLLKTKDFADSANRQRVLDALAGHGVAPERIELRDSGITPGWKEHMAYYDRLDIALDPVGAIGGGTTTCDALWMGVPVIALEGDRMASRMTASMLNAIGHPEWVAHSVAEYAGKVVALARDIAQRKTLRPLQRAKMAGSPLCDAHDLAVRLEDAYTAMFERWQARTPHDATTPSSSPRA